MTAWLNPDPTKMHEEGGAVSVSTAARHTTGPRLVPAERREALLDWLTQDLITAGEVQRAFLPELHGEAQGVLAIADYRPALQVGGDFYDVIRLKDGRVTAFVGDVAGRGITAALIMARVSQLFERLAERKHPPRAILEEVDQLLAERAPPDRFVTAVCVQLEPARGRWIAANAGHVVPLLRRRSGEIVRLAEPSAPPLGLAALADTPYRQEVIEAEEGDIVLLATDGITEALNGARRGDEDVRGLAKLLAEAPHDVEEIRRRVFEAVDARSERPDDATLVGLALTRPTGRL